jgi:dihydroceramidase
MIFACAFIAYVTFDTGSASLPPTRFVRCLPYLFFLYSFGVTVIYLQYPNPVFHQVAYGFIQT